MAVWARCHVPSSELFGNVFLTGKAYIILASLKEV